MIGDIERDASLRGKVIPLSFHVDYWNSLGWRDPYSSPEWSRRQASYARALNLEGPYTPQAVVDGHLQMVGSDRRSIYAALERASHDVAAARIAITGNAAHGSTSRPLDLFAAVVRGDPPTAVRAGENGGRTLRNDAIVRKLTHIAQVNGDFRQPIGDANVVFLQDAKTLTIYAAAAATTR